MKTDGAWKIVHIFFIILSNQRALNRSNQHSTVFLSYQQFDQFFCGTIHFEGYIRGFLWESTATPEHHQNGFFHTGRNGVTTMRLA